MTYELAKKLKDSGFSQDKKGGGDLCAHGGHNFTPTPDDCWDKVYCPTLEELIEACGNNFGSLDFYIPFQDDDMCINCNKERSEAFGAKKRWTVLARKCQIAMCGDTPEIAVANLWIALNKK